MGTPAAIGKEQPDGSIRVIYLSQDGSPSWAGRLLLTAWTTAERVQALLDLGDLANLGEEVGEPHDSDVVPHPAGSERWCRSFTRDRGERDRDAQTFEHLEALLRQCELDDTPWVYLYREGAWEMYSREWTHSPLTDVSVASRRE